MREKRSAGCVGERGLDSKRREIATSLIAQLSVEVTASKGHVKFPALSS